MDPWLPALLLCLSFFFSGIEIAFLSVNKLQLELSEKQGHVSGRIMSWFVHRPSWFFGTTRIGKSASLVIFSISITQFFTPLLTGQLPTVLNHRSVMMIIIIVLAAILILISTESLSKKLFTINPSRVLHLFAIPFGLSFLLLAPLTLLFIALSKFVVTRVLRSPYSEDDFFASTNVDTFLREDHPQKLEDQNLELDKKIFYNALEFKTVRIRDCMIPRTEIIASNVTDSIEKLTEAFVESGHSKIIIYKETLDDVIGYCHSSALFKKPARIEDILTPIIIVPETTLANELMIRFISERKSLAAVMDEFGGTSGIVSMEDIIEEIFGEIEDEHDEDDLIEQQLDRSTYLLSGRHEIDYLNEAYGLNLPTGDYDTLGGLILSFAEDFPVVGQTIVMPPFTFVIQSTQDNRIGTVRVTVEEMPEETED